ncbi:hypothetical protein [Zavarzinella formosa]|uniref:hypothetical protein n=1 Tax=Zavarzinella formosa TaxID=360055 RepID=UPI0002EF6678|nr:hypothetical protein [Zavarzinella formosa]
MDKVARVYEVTPHVGIGPLRLGMSPAEVRAAMPGHAIEKIGRGHEEMIEALGLNVDYSAGDAAVTFIQVFPTTGVRFTLWGIDVFATPADELVTALVRREGLLAADFPPGRDEYRFPSLRLVLWRRWASDKPGEPGWAFETVSVHILGYYEA